VAKIKAFVKIIDTGTLNFSFESDTLARYGYDNNKNVSYEGVTYEDTYTINEWLGMSVYMFGKSLTITSGGQPKSGTVQAFVINDGSMLPGADLLEVTGVSFSFTDFQAAIMSSSVKDDRAMIGRMLSGNDQVSLSINDDIFNAYAGNDRISGGYGNDVLRGSEGNDKLIGEQGVDTLRGGSGSDRFIFSVAVDTNGDRIVDFERSFDRIVLAPMDGNALVDGDQAFTFIRKQAFHGVAGELRFSHTDLAGTASDVTVVSGDINGDSIADFEISIRGLVKLAPTDFIL
jgi:Ca2+-binding RTX toxin-like protein